MDGVQEIDIVLQQVRQVAGWLHLPADAAITQQILLLGDAFYGYRFTASDFTAVWSATDQTLKVCNRDGKMLKIFSPKEAEETLSMSFAQRKAA